MDNFWNIVSFFFWAYVVIAYLLVLFSIIGDLFRDDTLNGWLKGLWMLFLVFVPFLTALVYLIARGNGMTRRAEGRVAAAQREADRVVTQSAGSSPARDIEQAHRLLDEGVIQRAQYDALKARALS
ncbi:MAG: PLDc N-terminal domain-containing protein [Cryobacterium sp.]